TGLRVLVAACRWPRGAIRLEHRERHSVAATGLAALRDPRTLEALIRVYDHGWIGDKAVSDAILAMTGERSRRDPWFPWLAEHRSELPAQLDPEALEVGPVVGDCHLVRFPPAGGGKRPSCAPMSERIACDAPPPRIHRARRRGLARRPRGREPRLA